jgi:hypothetical protein
MAWQPESAFAPSSGYKLPLMTISEKLNKHLASPTVAELWSFDRKKVFRLTIYGYESTQEEWLVADIEFHSEREIYKKSKWEFDTLALAVAARKLVRGSREDDQILLAAPYKPEQLKISYKKAKIYKFIKSKKAWPRFGRESQGLYVTANFSNFKFGFKVDRSALLKFHRSLREAASRLPAITPRGIECVNRAILKH